MDLVARDEIHQVFFTWACTAIRRKPSLGHSPAGAFIAALARSRSRGGRAAPQKRDDLVDQPLQIVGGPRDQTYEEVTLARRRVRLAHLGDSFQTRRRVRGW